MVTSVEVKKILDNLPQDLENVDFLADVYNTLSAYEGDEFAKEVKKALSFIKKFIDRETQKIYSPQDLTPEKAVALNDYLSIYEEDELKTTQKSLKKDIAPFLNKFDQENDITVNPSSHINNIQNSWEDASAKAIPVFSFDRENKIKIAEEYKEFEALLKPLKPADLQELINVLHINSIQDLSKNGSFNLNGDPSKYVAKLKENLEKADMQIRLAYLAIEKAEAAGKNAGDVDIDKAQSEYGITPEEIKNFNYSKANPERLAAAAHVVSCANTAQSSYMARRLRQKTNAQCVWYRAKKLQEEVSHRHPKLYNIAKSGYQAAKIAGLNAVLFATTGPVGVSVYATVRAYGAINKSIKEYQVKRTQAQQAKQDFPTSWLKYITAKENRLEAIGLAATVATTAVSVGFAAATVNTAVETIRATHDFSQGVAASIAMQAGNRMAMATTIGAVGLASGAALQREQVKAAEELKEFLISAGIAEKDISRKELYFAPKKHCAALLKENNIKFSASRQAEYEQKLNTLIQTRNAKRIRYGGAIIGTAAGAFSQQLIARGILGNSNNSTLLEDNIPASELLSNTPNDTLQENNIASINENPSFNENTSSAVSVPPQKASTQKASFTDTPQKATYTHSNTSNTYTSEQPSTEDITDIQKSQGLGDLSNPTDFYVRQPKDNVFVTNGGTRVELIEDDGHVEVLYSNSNNNYSEAECAEIDKNVYYVITEKQHPTHIEEQFAREYEATNNLPQANINQSVQAEPVVSQENTPLTEEEIIEKAKLEGKNIRVENTERNGHTIHRITVSPKAGSNATNSMDIDNNYQAGSQQTVETKNTDQLPQTQSQQGVQDQQGSDEQQNTNERSSRRQEREDHRETRRQEREDHREARRQEREDNREARRQEREANREARQNTAAEELQSSSRRQGPTHRINMGPEYHNYRSLYDCINSYCSQPSYSICEVPETGEPYLQISNYEPKVDHTLYSYVASTRVNATNGVQYVEAMGGAIKGHPSNFAESAREFCVGLEQRDLAFKDLMNRQAAGYQLTDREARWINDYRQEIASYGLAYDHGRLVPVLDHQHTMEKFYPDTPQGRAVDVVNEKAANNYDWSSAYNTNNRAHTSVVTGRNNQGR
ncbi:MAG: hypothetical protein J6Y53_05985 [Alphaproteobacteria bacterium]|nr:hypothetical protein [Alphaproteobacteria bacterium]